MSTTSLTDVLLGAQRPRVSSVPARSGTSGAEAVELAASVGLDLDPWQAWTLEQALGERPDGRWAALEVGLVVPRQNGKGAVLEARELAGLFLFGEQLILHSAHEFKTAAEAFRRVLTLVEGSDELRRRVSRVRTSHGEEGIELRDGARLRFVARSTGSGRGFSGDLVILDEAYNLSQASMAALLPTLSARENPQVWYTSSAPLRESEVLPRICKRGRAGSPRLAFMEWSAPPDAGLDDRAAWAQANPGLGIRLNVEVVEAEREALGDEEFARERLGIVPDVAAGRGRFDVEAWDLLADVESRPEHPVTFAVSVSPDRAFTSIGVAGARSDGLVHVGLVDRRRGTGWAADRVAELVAKWRPAGVLLYAAGAGASLLPDLGRVNVEVTPVTGREMAQACGMFYDAVTEKRLRHGGSPDLQASVTGAATRQSGDAWVWSWRSEVDISPVEAVTLAAYGHATLAASGQGPNLW